MPNSLIDNWTFEIFGKYGIIELSRDLWKVWVDYLWRSSMLVLENNKRERADKSFFLFLISNSPIFCGLFGLRKNRPSILIPRQRPVKISRGKTDDYIRSDGWHQILFKRSVPNRHFHSFRAMKSGDRQIVLSSGMTYDWFWSSKIVKGSVG